MSKFIEFGISVIEFGTLCASRAIAAVHLGVDAPHPKVALRVYVKGCRYGAVFAVQATILRPEAKFGLTAADTIGCDRDREGGVLMVFRSRTGYEMLFNRPRSRPVGKVLSTRWLPSWAGALVIRLESCESAVDSC